MRFVADGEMRLDKFLAEKMPEFSRSKLASAIASGEVTVNGQIAKPSRRLVPGEVVELDAPPDTPAHDLTPAEIPLQIVYEDEHLLVVDKPRGLASHPAASLKEPSLVNALLGRGQALSSGSETWRPGIVHRLDKDTTGLMVVAKTDQAHANLAKQIEGKTAHRTYLAVVAGDVERERFTIDAPLGRDPHHRLKMAVVAGGKRAVSHVLRLKRVDAGTLLQIDLETGRTHQIRVHLASMGHPVLGDGLYAPKALQDLPLQLHAWRLSFSHPVEGRRIECETPPPPDFLVQP